MFVAIAFTLFCLLCTVLAFTRHPIYGLYFYLATTYIFPPGRWWGYVFGELRWALLSAAVVALAIVVNHRKLKPMPLWTANGAVVLLILYALWMWIQLAWALDPSEHLRGTTEIAKCLLALWFVYRVVDSKERVRDLMLAHVLGCGLLGVLAQLAGRVGGRLDGVGGPNMDDANTLGMYFGTAAVCAIGLFLTQKGWRRYLCLPLLALIINGFVLTNSRGAFLGLVAGCLVLVLCTAKRYRWMFWGFAVAGFIGFAVLVDATFVERMYTIQDVASDDEEADPSARSRLEIAKAQLQMFVDYPMGTGWRGTVVLSTQYLDRKWLTLGDDETAARASHSTYLTALLEQGIPGALIYGSLVFWVLAAILRVRRLNRPHHDPELTTLGAALCAALVVVLVAGLTADYLTKEIQFWLYAALLSVLWLSESATEPGLRKKEASAPSLSVTRVAKLDR